MSSGAVFPGRPKVLARRVTVTIEWKARRHFVGCLSNDALCERASMRNRTAFAVRCELPKLSSRKHDKRGDRKDFSSDSPEILSVIREFEAI